MTFVSSSETVNPTSPTTIYTPKGRAFTVAKIITPLAFAAAFILFYVATRVAEDQGIILVFAAAAALFGFFLAYRESVMTGYEVTLDADTLKITQRGQTKTVRWDNVDAIWQAVTKHYTNGIYTGTTHIYTIKTNDGQKVVLNDTLNNVENLGHQCQEAVSARIYPKVLDTVNNGGTVYFDKIGVSQTGISHGDKSLPWTDVDEVKVENGVIQVRKQGKWLNWKNINVASVPNLYVFLSLINNIVGINQGKRSR